MIAVLVRDSEPLTVPQAARRLEISGEQLYRWVFEGLVVAAPDATGAVRVDAAAVEDLRQLSADLARHQSRHQ